MNDFDAMIAHTKERKKTCDTRRNKTRKIRKILHYVIFWWVFAAIAICNKINERFQWNEERAKKILLKLITDKAEYFNENGEEGYIICRNTPIGWYSDDFDKYTSNFIERRWARRFRMDINAYLEEKFEVKGYRKEFNLNYSMNSFDYNFIKEQTP